MKRFTSFAIALSLSAPALAQQGAADPARQDAVVKQAMSVYQQGLSDINRDTAAGQPGTSSGTFRELRLEEAVSLALEKNLDIQVAKLEPQSVDFLVAGFENQYMPVLSSTVGQRENFQLPTRTLTGGNRVNQGTLTYNASIAQTISKWGGNYSVAWSNSK